MHTIKLGYSEIQIASQLGHASTKTTRKYIEDIESNNLKRNKEIYNDYHVIYEDYDGHWARLKTNKDFGCIDFEEKQK